MSETTFLDINCLVESPFWPRMFRDTWLEGKNQKFNELVESIRKQGIAQPLRVRPLDDSKYEIVFGHRRYYAAQKAGVKQVPAVNKACTDEEAILLQFVENELHEDLSDMEKAHFLATMIEKFNLTQDQVAKKINKDPAWVSRHLRMLTLEEEPLLPRGKMDEVTEKQAREILKVPEENKVQVAEAIEQHVKETGKLPSANTIHSIAHPTVLVACDNCGTQVGKTFPFMGKKLCGICHEKATQNPEYFKAKFADVDKQNENFNIERESSEHQHFVKQVITSLEERGVRGMALHRVFCVEKVTATVFLSLDGVAVFIDDPKQAQARREHDRELREKMPKEVRVLQFESSGKASIVVEQIEREIKNRSEAPPE